MGPKGTHGTHSTLLTISYIIEPETSPQDLTVELQGPTTALLTWKPPYKKRKDVKVTAPLRLRYLILRLPVSLVEVRHLLQQQPRATLRALDKGHR